MWYNVRIMSSYYLTHPEFRERQKVLAKKYRLANKEKRKEWSKKWWAKNAERIKLKRLAEKDRWQLYFKEYNLKNIEKRREQARIWRNNNPDRSRISRKKQKHRRRALGNINFTEWITKVAMLGNKCQICFRTEPEIKITIDHIIPVSKGGTNHIDNLQPLCVGCNSKKHNKTLSNYDIIEIRKRALLQEVANDNSERNSLPLVR